MNKKQKIIVSIAGIIIVLLTLLGLTYGYYLARIIGNTNSKSIDVITADTELTFLDGSNTITANNIIPGDSITGNEGKIFSVKNTGDVTINYAVVLDNVTNQFYNESDVQYKLYKSGNLVSTGFIRNSTANNYQKQVLYDNVSIDSGKTDEYKLVVDYIESGVDQSVDMGKILTVRVNIADAAVNSRGVVAEHAYQEYIMLQKNGTPSNKSMLTFIEDKVANEGYKTDNIIIKDNNVIAGSAAIAFGAGVEIGDKIFVGYNLIPKGCFGGYGGSSEWYVLGVDGEGDLMIFSRSNPGILFYDKDTYSKATNILNERVSYCSDGEVLINARSATVEDINKVTGYNPYNVGVKSESYDIGTKYEQGNLREYMNTVTFKHTSAGIVTIGSNGASDINTTYTRFLPYQSSSALIVDDADSSYTVTRNYYSYYPETLSTTKYTTGSPVVGLSSTSKEYKMLFSDSTNYFLADNYIDAKSGIAQWGMRKVYGARVTGTHWWDSAVDLTTEWKNGQFAYIAGIMSINNLDSLSFTKKSTSGDVVTYNLKY